MRPNPPEVMTPEEVSDLSPQERRARVRSLIEYSHDLLSAVMAEEERKPWRNPRAEDKTPRDHLLSVTSVCSLFSGGNDSTTLAHMFRSRTTHAIHANTTIGIEQTREYVRKVCADWGLPLIEKTAPVSYRDLVLEQGFPGPGHHYKMYQRLKERGLREARKELIGPRGKRERVVFLAGRRRTESERRANVPEVEYEGAIVWVSPLVYWTKLDLNTYREMHEDVPRNEVSDLLHMSGECLCGSFAHPGELDEIALFYPDVAKEIRDLEVEVLATGKHAPEKCKWGFRKGKPTKKAGALCSDCKFTTEGKS
ncbi:PAPS reductase-like domain protein [Rhodococcus phage ChewyVIII]|uniref:PAPS reductase-like domain protein n=1 Tax=Rhodococcus phage ChewyVIII TaxID=1887657 RepID=A0A1C9EIC6_9CAUD|nr:PAPS reductase-like domain protein [Rhodococcus phage ChewyVIII]AON97500.1 PAPS reductase-like domain protein [Rhodococcus phage ChewyVIII]